MKIVTPADTHPCPICKTPVPEFTCPSCKANTILPWFLVSKASDEKQAQ